MSKQGTMVKLNIHRTTGVVIMRPNQINTDINLIDSTFYRTFRMEI